jgi:PKHD-type hydroxylase
MNISNAYWCFDKVLTPRFCDEVIKYGLSQEESIARTGDFSDVKLDKDQIKDLKRKRNSDLVWMDDPWIYKEIHPYVHIANKNAGWNFQWDWSESCQFTKYKRSQYYDWHCDSWNKPYDKEGPQKGKIRKLSMTCQLTDGSEYEGGELEFDFRNYDPNIRDKSKHVRRVTEILPKGSIIVFPSHLWHRVRPVTKGIRYSLVAWHLGHPFK